jgi:sec-independent protein translocase protein TatC
MMLSNYTLMSQLQKMTIWEHLGELKKRIKMVLIAYGVCLVFWLMMPTDLLDLNGLMTGMYRPFISLVLDHASGLAAGRITIIAGSLTSPLEIYFYASAILAMITASPVIAYEFYKFIDPALLPHEKGLIYKFTVAFVGLLTGGALVGYFLLTPATIRFMSYFAVVVNAQSVITAADYYGIVFLIVGATGIAFTSPAIFVLLIRFGIVSTSTLTKNRLTFYGALYIAIVVLTPEPLVAHVGMFLPIVALMEVSVIVGKRVEKNRLKERAKKSADVHETGWLPTENGVTCAHCGAKAEKGKGFCSSCGRSLV